MKATDFLAAAQSHMADRAKTYDRPDGERSMARTVAAFNAVTGHNLSESDGWMMMMLLKAVRLTQRATYHADSAEDLVAYAALLGEARSNTSTISVTEPLRNSHHTPTIATPTKDNDAYQTEWP